MSALKTVHEISLDPAQIDLLNAHKVMRWHRRRVGPLDVEDKGWYTSAGDWAAWAVEVDDGSPGGITPAWSPSRRIDDALLVLFRLGDDFEHLRRTDLGEPGVRWTVAYRRGGLPGTREVTAFTVPMAIALAALLSRGLIRGDGT